MSSACVVDSFQVVFLHKVVAHIEFNFVELAGHDLSSARVVESFQVVFLHKVVTHIEVNVLELAG